MLSRGMAEKFLAPPTAAIAFVSALISAWPAALPSDSVVLCPVVMIRPAPVPTTTHAPTGTSPVRSPCSIANRTLSTIAGRSHAGRAAFAVPVAVPVEGLLPASQPTRRRKRAIGSNLMAAAGNIIWKDWELQRESISVINFGLQRIGIW
ncbi:MAG: hypothetical protein UZ07_CHB004003311 [Chlorobi bacterium OLB7]|nr:MAG: hypothetical protein UZ07_CHB004003311 [Chlorobi bacterium OLB7]